MDNLGVKIMYIIMTKDRSMNRFSLYLYMIEFMCYLCDLVLEFIVLIFILILCIDQQKEKYHCRKKKLYNLIMMM